MQKVICPYCNEPAKFIDSREIFGKSYGMLYVCSSCDARVGCNKQSNKPLGTLANRKLRSLRSKAHANFDIIWKSSLKKNARSIAYSKLANKMDISRSKCHIGMFNEDQCREVIRLSKIAKNL